MAFLKHCLSLCALLHCLLSLLHLVNGEVDLEELFKGFNIYKNSQSQLYLNKNSKAQCIAEQIAKKLYNQLPCSRTIDGDALLPSNQSQLPLFTHYSRKCQVNLNHTLDAVILPIYVPNSEAELVLAGCKHSQASKYLGNTTYTRVGLAKNKDCLVIALGTDALGGSYSAGVSRIQNIVKEDVLFQAMNSYRKSIKLTPMNKNSKAGCLVKQIAWDFDDQSPLSIFLSGSTIAPSNFSQLPSLPDYLSKCKIELNHTKNGLILPLHIPTLALNLVLHECTNSQMAKYWSKPEFTSVGIGCFEQWVVFAFATDSPTGSFSSAVNLSDLGLRHFYLVSSVLLGLLLLSG